MKIFAFTEINDTFALSLNFYFTYNLILNLLIQYFELR